MKIPDLTGLAKITGIILSTVMQTNIYASPPAQSASVASDKKFCIRVNYSSVPALVNRRVITLKVNVGTCVSVTVLADGVFIPVVYKKASGEAVFTTKAVDVVVTAYGCSTPGTGKVTKAYLLDDHHWAFSQTFDDEYLDVWQNAKPMLDEKGWKAGIACVASFASAAWGPQMSWEQMETLWKSGWDIFNHSYSHPHLSCEDFEDEFELNDKEMKEHFPGYHVNHIVYPFEDNGFTSCKKFPLPYLLSAQKGSNSNAIYVDEPIENIYSLNRSGQYGTDNTTWKAEADNAAEEKSPTWIIKITHHVYPGNTPGADPAYSTTHAALKDFYDYLDTKYGAKGDNSMWFAPAGTVMDYIFTRDNVKVSSCPSLR